MYENIQEGQYLIKLLSAAVNNVTPKAPVEDLDWENLYRLASFHNVANTAYYSLLKLSNPALIPKDIMSKFASEAKKYSSLEALQHYESRQTLQKFEEHRVVCVPLSGYVMKSFYPRPDMRYEACLSLFVSPEHKQIAHGIMRSLGYREVRSTETSSSYHKDPDISIELLTSLLPERNEYCEYFKSIIKNNLQREKGFQYIYRLSNEDFYIYMITYLAHKYAAGDSGIRSILDIWVYLKRYNPILNREMISQELNKLNLGLFSFYIEELSWIWFGDGISFSNQSLYEEMEQHIFSCGIGDHFDIGESVASTIATNEEAEPLSKEVRNEIFPSLEIMSERYPLLKKMPFLLPVFWLSRLSGALLTKMLKPFK